MANTVSEDPFEELREDFHARQRARQKRSLEKLWAQMKPAPDSIQFSAKAKPKRGEDWVVEVMIGDLVDTYVVPGVSHTTTGEHTTQEHEYRPKAQEWALWRWHTNRGTPVGDNDQYLTEPNFKAPAMDWEDKKAA